MLAPRTGFAVTPIASSRRPCTNCQASLGSTCFAVAIPLSRSISPSPHAPSGSDSSRSRSSSAVILCSVNPESDTGLCRRLRHSFGEEPTAVPAFRTALAESADAASAVKSASAICPRALRCEVCGRRGLSGLSSFPFAAASKRRRFYPVDFCRSGEGIAFCIRRVQSAVA